MTDLCGLVKEKWGFTLSDRVNSTISGLQQLSPGNCIQKCRRRLPGRNGAVCFLWEIRRAEAVQSW